MMNLVGKVSLVTCVFAITLQVSSSDQAKYPIHHEESTQFERDITLDCGVVHSNLSEILWYRNGKDLCTPDAVWCNEMGLIYRPMPNGQGYNYQNSLTLPRLTRDGKYSCLAIPGHGSNWTVHEIQVIVVPKTWLTTYHAYGDARDILCSIAKYGFEVRLVRDGNETCTGTPDDTWCEIYNTTEKGSSRKFQVLNLQNGHNFTCEAYIGSEKQSKVSVHPVEVGPTPDIYEVTVSPPGTQLRGATVVLSARITSPTRPTSILWQRYDQSFALSKKEMMDLSENEYETQASPSEPLFSTTNFSLTVTNQYGKITKSITVDVDPTMAVPIYNVYGRDAFITCEIQTPKMQFQVVRDGDDKPCSVNSVQNWCQLEKSDDNASRSKKTFRILTLRTNHNYTCQAFDKMDDQTNIKTTLVQPIIVVYEPKILQLTLSPPSPIPRDTNAVITARFKWDGAGTSAIEPLRGWGLHVLQNQNRQSKVEDNLILVSENEYKTKFSIGPIKRSGEISLVVKSDYGQDDIVLDVVVTVQHGESCDVTVLCQPNTTICKWNYMGQQCSCPDEYFYDQSVSNCRKSVRYGEPCEATSQCEQLTSNSECHAEENICVCISGFGVKYLSTYNYNDRVSCERYPIYDTDRYVQFEKDRSGLDCTFISPKIFNITEIRWVRNEQDICTSYAEWCSTKKGYSLVGSVYRLEYSLNLRNVITNGTYNCHVIASEGNDTIIATTKVIVTPNDEKTMYTSFGSDNPINCKVETKNLDVRLVRDGQPCTNDVKWCLQREDTFDGSSSNFDVFNQRSNNTYTCEVYSGGKKLSTVAIYHLKVGSGPQIINLTLSPESQQKGMEVVATALFSSFTQEKLVRRWTLYDGVQIKELQREQLSFQSEDKYQSVVSFGPFERASKIKFEVSNSFGYDEEDATLGVKHGDSCNSAVVCATEYTGCDHRTGLCECRPGQIWNASTGICLRFNEYGQPCDSTIQCDTDNTECDRRTGQCLCVAGYHWESSICKENGVAVQKGGIVMLALAILLTLFRSTTFTAC